MWQAGAAILSFVIFFGSMFLSFQTGVNRNLNAAIQDLVPVVQDLVTETILVVDLIEIVTDTNLYLFYFSSILFYRKKL